MNEFKGIRFAVGFRRENTKATVDPRCSRPWMTAILPPVLAPYSDRDKEGYSSLEEVIAGDRMHWVLESDDPISSALSLRSRFLENR